ncbi:MAG: replicative DNA helicase [Bdellovibrionaceae bacterium]|nr:replicative DNA helicase [Pseudobdellovibrionaceae bacterium]
MAGRLPPQNIEAEQSILGALMLDSMVWDSLGDQISAEDFYKPAHGILFTTFKTLIAKNQPVDLITVTNYLTGENQLQAIGGTEYLVELVNRTVSTANVVTHAKIVREKALVRRAIHISGEVIDQGYSEDFESVAGFLDEAEGKFYRLGEARQTEGLVSPMELVKQSIKEIEERFKKKAAVTGLGSGFTGLDKMTSGFNPGELLILAARPSMGKTAFSLNIAQHIALRLKKTVAYFSLEMSKEAVMMRLLASEARVNMGELKTGQISDSAWPKLIDAAGRLSEAPLFIDDTSGISPFEVRSRCRRLKAQHGLDCIMIDYLQIMKLKEKVDSREREVAEISGTLKAIAKELRVPVIALAQLNRGVESRTEKKPMLSDLRESGSIEQDADVIMMLYREEYYDKSDEKKGHAEVIIGKQRNGPTGTVALRFDGQFGRFRDADPEPSHPMPPPPMQPPAGVTPFGGSKPKNFAPGAQT